MTRAPRTETSGGTSVAPDGAEERLAAPRETPLSLCEGCQFGPTPDFPPDDPALAPYRTRRYFPGGPLLECHRVAGRACAGLLREMRERLRVDGDYFRAQTWFRDRASLHELDTDAGCGVAPPAPRRTG